MTFHLSYDIFLWTTDQSLADKGHLCHASLRAQFYGQLIGSSLSIVVTATAFALYNRAYTIPGPSFPAPTAYVWLGLARLLRKSAQAATWTES